jgi:hypothetical protein
VRRYQCDPQYIEALGYAVFSFAILEYNIANIIERFRPGYVREYISQEKTAGTVANDFDQAIVEQAKGHAAEAELLDISKAFRDLKNRRNKLLHANPLTAPDGAQVLRHQALDILWDLETVCQAAKDFEDAAVKAGSLLHGALRA